MTVNDKSFERIFVRKKFLANPEQIIFCLFVDRNSRPNAGVDEQKIPTAE